MALAGALVLTGCATGPASNPSVSPSSSVSPSEATARGTDPLAEFTKVATDSCDKANAEGVVENITDDGKQAYKVIMTAKAEAYQDYSAVGVDPAGVTEIIYEAYAFEVCYFAGVIGLATEGGTDVSENLTVTYDQATNSYTAEEDAEMAGEVQTTRYFIDDAGLMTKVDYPTDTDGPFVRTITFGAPGAEDLKILQTAVDELLSSTE